MKRKKVINRLLNILLALTLVISGVGVNVPQITVMAASVKTSNMLTECVPYYLEKSTIEDSVVMAGVTYNDTIKVSLDSDSHQRRIGFNLAELYTAVSFEVGHIDGTGTANGNIVLSTYCDGKLCDSYDLDVNDVAKKISCDTVGVSQLEIVITYDYYTGIKGYFGIGALNFVRNSENSAINLHKTSNMSEECIPYYLERTTIEDSVVMGGVIYSDALKVSLDSDSTSRRIGFNLQNEYKNLSFEIGHIDKTGLANGEVVVSIYKDSVCDSSYDLNINDIAKKIKCDVTGVSQFELVITYDYYTGVKGYFGIGALNLQRSAVPVSRVDLDMSSVSMKVGEEKLLTASIFPENATDKTLTWKSTDTGVATVSQNGLVKAVAEGKTTITVTSRNNVTASCAVTVSAEEHTHSFSDEWKSTSDYHWRECECGSIQNCTPHSFTWVIDKPATEASTGLKHEECEVCSYRRNEGTVIDKLTGEHTHSYKEWGRDVEAHWKECECGDKIEMEPHFFSWVIDEPATEASTGLKHEECEVCSCKRNEGTVIDKLTGEHIHSYREWGRNVEAHWKECECGDKIEMEPHSYGWKPNAEKHWRVCVYCEYVDIEAAHAFSWVIDEPATETSTGLKHEECKVCSYKRNEGTVIAKLTSEHTHSFSASWKSDAKSHWIECECGEKFAAASHAFTWVIDKPATEASTGLKHEECTVCGYKRNENTVIGKLDNTPAKGQKLTDRKSGAAYKVVIAKTKGGTVEYTKPLNNNTANISIPSTVKIDDISYKVTSIAANAFINNKKITKVKIGSNVTSIGKNAFNGCSKLKTLAIGNNVVSIGDNAFLNCTSLKTVTIPTKVTKIGKQAFCGCKKLKTIKISTKKLVSKNVGNKAFAKIDLKAAVKVPASCLKYYKKLLQKKGVNGKKQKIKK